MLSDTAKLIYVILIKVHWVGVKTKKQKNILKVF